MNNMILILSVENEASTDDVISWIRHKNINYVRLNPTDIIGIKSFEISNDKINVALQAGGVYEVIDLETIAAYWYRRGELKLPIDKSTSESKEFPLFNYLRSELGVVEDYIDYRLKNLPRINSKSDNRTNKLVNLHIAASCGLNIPKTWVVNSDNKSTISKTDELITKAFFNGTFRASKKLTLFGYTERIKPNQITTSFPSCVQNELKKSFELRVFYINGDIYTVAIFSQQSQQTKVDFRKYNSTKPNRSVPFCLPERECEKIRSFMSAIDINCGSIDMIVSEDNQYYFIEVNPIGQFQQVSIPGNY